MNKCQAGHKIHDIMLVDTVQGSMHVYDWEKYKDQTGLYCTGQDDISRTIKQTGSWAPVESAEVKKILENGDRENLVVDVGCHIGWYTLMAAKLGYKVHSIDGDEENLDLLKNNLLNNDIDITQVIEKHLWLDKKTKSLNLNGIEVELLKIDIEGSEQYAVKMYEKFIKAKKIKNIFMEVSPVFNDSYPGLVEKIKSYGYAVYKDGIPFDFKYDFTQSNLLFVLT